MVTKDTTGFKCAVCGLHYRLPSEARACQDFCTKNKACSPEITKSSIERSVKQ